MTRRVYRNEKYTEHGTYFVWNPKTQAWHRVEKWKSYDWGLFVAVMLYLFLFAIAVLANVGPA